MFVYNWLHAFKHLQGFLILQNFAVPMAGPRTVIDFCEICGKFFQRILFKRPGGNGWISGMFAVQYTEYAGNFAMYRPAVTELVIVDFEAVIFKKCGIIRCIIIHAVQWFCKAVCKHSPEFIPFAEIY